MNPYENIDARKKIALHKSSAEDGNIRQSLGPRSHKWTRFLLVPTKTHPRTPAPSLGSIDMDKRQTQMDYIYGAQLKSYSALRLPFAKMRYCRTYSHSKDVQRHMSLLT